MAVDLKPGLRVKHQRHGLGTITAVHADAVEVEHDEQDTVRRYVLALCTLTTEDGEPLVKSQAQRLAEHPPTDQHHHDPKALEPKDTAMPAKPTDQLLNDMDAALRERGPGAGALLAAACGLVTGCHRNWRNAGRIPDQHRDAVAAWVKAPHAQPPAGKPKASPAKANPRPRGTIPAPRRIPKPTPPPATRLDATTVLAALGFTLTDAWLPDGDTMRRVRVAVLPA